MILMRNIVWVINMPIGPVAQKLNTINSSGSWLKSAIAEINTAVVALYILTTCNSEQRIELCENGVVYIALPTGSPADYRCTGSNIAAWHAEFERIRPDIIQIWGTEYKHALVALKAKPKGTKTLVYIQGVMQAVVDTYMGGISTRTMRRFTSPVEIVTGKSIFAACHAMKKTIVDENTILSLADGIIYETEWSRSYYTFHNGCKNFYYHRLPVNTAFYRRDWSLGGIERHKIFTPASDYPLKGLHKLIEALTYVKKTVPDVRLYVPGFRIKRELSFSEKLKSKAYRKYLTALINKHDLWDNIVFTGTLTPAQMAENMENANVFVCTSAIENHSSTLREAMIVGTPCISTCVGGIPEYFVNNKNGLMYDFYDTVALAKSILSIFNDDILASKLGAEARRNIREYYGKQCESINEVYEHISDTPKKSEDTIHGSTNNNLCL